MNILFFGQYTSADGKIHGYLLSGDRFTSIDFPDACATAGRGITAAGDIVGNYILVDGQTPHGYLLSQGNFTSIDFPGATSTMANGINPRGDIVGTYIDSNNKTHGFLLRAEDQNED